METHGEQVVVQDSEDAEQQAVQPSKSSSRVWLLPALLGALILVLNAVLPLSSTYKWAYHLGSWSGGSNLILLAVSIFSGLFLIVYALGLWRFEQNSSAKWSSPSQVDVSQGLRFRAGVLVPLALSLVGVSTLWFSFNATNARSNPIMETRPCVELYGDALAISKERPNFRMPAQDPDEARCGINKALFG